MKKIILISVLIISTMICFGQTYTVIDSKITDEIAKKKVEISKEQTQREQRIFMQQMQNEDRLYDTIYNQSAIDAYLTAKWNAHYAFKDYFSEPDTITIEKIGSQYYINGDTTEMSLNDERTKLIDKYNRLLSTYGEMVKYDPRFTIIKERYDQLQDWLTQIQDQ